MQSYTCTVPTSDELKLTPALVKQPLVAHVQQCAALHCHQPSLSRQVKSASVWQHVRSAACPLGSMSGILPTIARMQRSVIAATQDMMHLRRGQIWP